MRIQNRAIAVRWVRCLRGPAPGWIGALLVGLLAIAEPGEAVTLNPGDLLITQQSGDVILVSPAGGTPTPVASGPPLAKPFGIAIAATGDLFVVDSTSGVIRINPVDGSMTVVSEGQHFKSPSAIAIAASGDLFVVDQTCCQGTNGGVIRVNPAGPKNDNQTVVSQGQHFVQPVGIAIGGELFVLDLFCCANGNGGVIRVNPDTGAQTVLSQGQQTIGGGAGIAIAPGTGQMFVASSTCCDSANSGGVFQVNRVDGAQTVVTSQQTPGSPFATPGPIAVAANGDLFVGDLTCCQTGSNSGGVIRVNPLSGAQTPVAHGAGFHSPMGIAIVPVSSPRPPATCGASVPCACGDLVVRDRTLRGTDPVTRTVCPADGLVVAAGVTLDLGGATLRGQGAGAGVRIESGATDVTLRRGRITGFATGVRGEGTTGVHVANVQVLDSAQDGVTLTGDGHTVEVAVVQGSGGFGVTVSGHASGLSRLQVRGNSRAGVRLLGGGHTVEQSAIEGNAEAGVEVSGDANEVALLQLNGNGGDGGLVMGTGNLVTRNGASRNGGDGLEIQGARAVVGSNRATSNGEAGLEIHGTAHTVSLNVAGQNIGTGLQMLSTTGSRFDRNRGENNGGYGIADDSTGTGMSGTANTYTQNTCGRGNGAGASAPAGLCR